MNGEIDQTRRADALAATIAALRDVVTHDGETKSDFVARVRAILSACPDARVLHAVAAEREAQYKRRGVLAFNPYTGTPRHPSDIASDPHAILLLDPEQPLRAVADRARGSE